MGLPLKWPQGTRQAPEARGEAPGPRPEAPEARPEAPAGGGCCADPASDSASGRTSGLQCPQCGLPLDGPTARCPRCYASLLVPNSCSGACSKCNSGCGLRVK